MLEPKSVLYQIACYFVAKSFLSISQIIMQVWIVMCLKIGFEKKTVAKFAREVNNSSWQCFIPLPLGRKDSKDKRRKFAPVGEGGSGW